MTTTMLPHAVSLRNDGGDDLAAVEPTTGAACGLGRIGSEREAELESARFPNPTEAVDKALKLKPNHPRHPDRRTKPKSSPEENVFGQQTYHIGSWHFRGMFAVLVVGKILSIPRDGESRPIS